ncbi:MAG TPA: NAD(P)H-hydrate dehydratase [Prevotellaceae bacterium]|nr:NAD(P)H-hydrate dehydratase [Prevotellaceae bacterium]
MYRGKQYLCSMASVMTPVRMARMLRPRPDDAHKGTMGHALLVAGSAGVGGCAVLAAESCLRAGVGKLTVCTPVCNRLLVQVSVPEAVLRTLPHLGVNAPSSDARGYSQWQAVGIGPGIGPDAGVLLHSVLALSAPLPLAVDADALRVLAVCPEWVGLLRGRAVLTPHGGEMLALARGLLACEGGLSGGDALLRAVCRLAVEAGVWVVLKGHPTHVCHPDGRVDLCPRGNAGMATAGAGDVLTGIVTGLLAQGYEPGQAASLGVWLHATAGDRAAGRLGQEAMLARDIIAHLCEAWSELHKAG